MKVLLTGAGGFLGRALYDNLIARGHEVIPVVRNSSNIPEEIVFDFKRDDISCLEESVRCCESIIHLAAMIDFKKDFNPDLYQVNLISTLKLANLAGRYNKHFIFASSVSISQIDKGVIDENSRDFPDNSYSLSKYLAEKAVESLSLFSCIVRIGGIYGKGGPEHLYLNKAITEALHQGIAPTVVGTGTSLRNYIYVGDLAKWFTFLAEKKQTGKLLVGGSEVLEIKAILSLVTELYLEGKDMLFRAHPENSSDFIIKGNPPPFPLHTYREAFLDILRWTNKYDVSL